MKPITIRTPITLVALLGGGVVLCGIGLSLHRLLVPWILMIGFLLLVAGLLLGLIDFFRTIATLLNAEGRRSTGVIVPLLTVLIALGAWVMVVSWAIQAKRLMDKRAQYELEHRDELHGTNESQQSVPGYPPQGVGSPEP